MNKKQQSRIQECVKCKQTFASYHIQEKCNECETINTFVKEFVSKETDKPTHKQKGKIWKKKQQPQ